MMMRMKIFRLVVILLALSAGCVGKSEINPLDTPKQQVQAASENVISVEQTKEQAEGQTNATGDGNTFGLDCMEE